MTKENPVKFCHPPLTLGGSTLVADEPCSILVSCSLVNINQTTRDLAHPLGRSCLFSLQSKHRRLPNSAGKERRQGVQEKCARFKIAFSKRSSIDLQKHTRASTCIRSPNVRLFRCLGNRKPSLRLESGRICVMDELFFCLPERKWMSICIHWAHLAA